MNRTERLTASISRNPARSDPPSNEMVDILSRIERVLVLAEQRNDQRFHHLESVIGEGLEATHNSICKELAKLNRRLKNIAPSTSNETSPARSKETGSWRQFDASEEEKPTIQSIPNTDRSNSRVVPEKLSRLPQIKQTKLNKELLIADQGLFKSHKLIGGGVSRYAGSEGSSTHITERPPLKQEFKPTPQPVGSATVRAQQEQTSYFGEFRDRQLIVAFKCNPNSTLASLEGEIALWTAEVVDIITKQAFEGYSSGKIAEDECRVFVCNNFLLNMHELIHQMKEHQATLWKAHSQSIMETFQAKLSSALNFSLSKYPQKPKIFISKELSSIIKPMDTTKSPVNSLILKLNAWLNPLKFDPTLPNLKAEEELDPEQVKVYDESEFALKYDYRGCIKKLLNSCIQQAREKYDDFEKLMKEIFKVQSKDKPSPQLLSDFKIGMKFKKDMPALSQQELDDYGIPIHSPEVLRVLIKWIEELDEIISKPSKYFKSRIEPFIVSSEDDNKRTPEYLTYEAKQRLLEEFTQTRKEYAEWLIPHKSVLDSIFYYLPEYIEAHRKDFDFLPSKIVESGLTVSLGSAMTSDTVPLLLNNQLGYLFQTLKRAFPLSSNLIDKQVVPFLEFVPFSVMDLLRAKCSGTLDEIKQVLNKLEKHSDIQLIRVKNRLDTGNRDFLINFSFTGCNLICELQVGLKDGKSDPKESMRDHFNHFIYELCRSRFGPIPECTLIIHNQTEIGTYFRKNTHPNKFKTNRLAFEPYIKDNQIHIPGYEIQDISKSFFCGNCLEPSFAFLSFMAGYKKTGTAEFLCAQCIYQQMGTEQRTMCALGVQGAGSFKEVTDLADLERQTQPCVATIDPKKYGSLRLYQSDIPPAEKIIELLEITDEKLRREKREEQKRINEIIRLRPGLAKYREAIGKDLLLRGNDFEGKLIFTLTSGFESHYQRYQLTEEENNNKNKIVAIIQERLKDVATPEAILFLQPRKYNHSYKSSEIFKYAVHKNSKQVVFVGLLNGSHNYWVLNQMQINENITENKWAYSGKSLDESVLKWKGQANQVDWIDLHDNRFKRVDFMTAANLNFLSLSSNLITTVQIPQGTYPRLKSLNLSNNKIKELNWRKLHVPMLEALFIGTFYGNEGGNPLEKFEADGRTLPSLAELHLRQCKKLESVVLNELTSLKQLFTECSLIRTMRLKGSFTKLEILSSYCGLSEQVDLSKCAAPHLREINFECNKLSSFSLPHECPAIEKIRLSCNLLKEFSLAGVQSEPSSEELLLDLSRNKLVSVNLGPNWKEDCRVKILLDVSMNPDVQLAYNSQHDFSRVTIDQTNSAHARALWSMQFLDENTLKAFYEYLVEKEVKLISIQKSMIVTAQSVITTLAVYNNEPALPERHELVDSDGRITNLFQEFMVVQGHKLEKEDSVLSIIYRQEQPLITEKIGENESNCKKYRWGTDTPCRPQCSEGHALEFSTEQTIGANESVKCRLCQREHQTEMNWRCPRCEDYWMCMFCQRKL